VRSAVILATAAALAYGCRQPSPGSGARAGAWFQEVAQQTGLRYTYHSGHSDRYLLPEIMGGGVALFEFDGDGYLDAYLVQGGHVLDPKAGQGNRLFRNRGDGTFEDVTPGSGADVRGYGMGVAAGDYDNDGLTDLYVTRLGSNVLLRNDGHGRLVDVTSHAGVADSGWSASAAFVDYDDDGDLDLFVAHYVNWSIAQEQDCQNMLGGADYCSPRKYDAPSLSTLYRNNGNGTFTDASAAAGIHAAAGNGLGVASGDFNGDGRIDIFVANDSTPNHLWLNQGDGRFRDVALVAGCAVDYDGKAKAGMGTHATYATDGGKLDLFVVNLAGESDSFFRNQGEYFVDDTIGVGLRAPSRPFTRFGAALLDFDNDGRLDLYEANGRIAKQADRFGEDPYAEPSLLFRGMQNRRFVEIEPRGGTSSSLVATSRGTAFGDVDNDGGVDIVVVNRDAPAYVLHNVVANRGHWLTFRVTDEHGRDALGATVSVSADGRQVKRDVQAAFSYLASNDPRVHIGLGAATRAVDVTVSWVDGQSESFGAFEADQIRVLHRGAGVRVPK
jgi:enediyne biosynthesis protein E4